MNIDTSNRTFSQIGLSPALSTTMCCRRTARVARGLAAAYGVQEMGREPWRLRIVRGREQWCGYGQDGSILEKVDVSTDWRELCNGIVAQRPTLCHKSLDTRFKEAICGFCVY